MKSSCILFRSSFRLLGALPRAVEEQAVPSPAGRALWRAINICELGAARRGKRATATACPAGTVRASTGSSSSSTADSSMAPAKEGPVFCTDTMACINQPGYTCKDERCVCDPERDTGLLSCRGRSRYGEKCRMDEECSTNDEQLICSRTEVRTCRCPIGLVWDDQTRKCYSLGDYSNKFDPVRDLIIPGIIVMTIGAMVYLGIKLFCNCGKLWRRRRRRPDLSRELDEYHQQQATWVASYRVFSSLNGVESRASPVLSPSSSFPLHPTPCMGLFLPATSSLAASASPPSYEESLKHKVILSSYPLTVVLPPAGSSTGEIVAPIPTSSNTLPT